jgi:hypothetical protein
MSIAVYYLEMVNDLGGPEPVPRAEHFGMSEMTPALNRMQVLRNMHGISHVGMVIENPDSVGKPGVAAVENGKTPDGHDYTWKKRRV